MNLSASRRLIGTVEMAAAWVHEPVRPVPACGRLECQAHTYAQIKHMPRAPRAAP